MHETAPFTLDAWQSFYVIVGSSAGALTGLQFVVLTLISEARMLRAGDALSAFASPNVVHFCMALLVSAILGAPWGGLGPPGVAVALCGAGGLIYSIAVLRRAMRQRDYRPVLEDWIWHAAFPMLAYAAMIHAGIQMSRVSSDVLYIVGGASLMLVFVDIHNAWDTVTYVMAERSRREREQARAAAAAAATRRQSE
ncbi:MAG: hypothetical protein HYR74_04905 [Candidatus Eisenbacteria bacterium]|nr:hypothetical protein [Candidatus Eisenbacteria bacterium]